MDRRKFVTTATTIAGTALLLPTDAAARPRLFRRHKCPDSHGSAINVRANTTLANVAPTESWDVYFDGNPLSDRFGHSPTGFAHSHGWWYDPCDQFDWMIFGPGHPPMNLSPGSYQADWYYYINTDTHSRVMGIAVNASQGSKDVVKEQVLSINSRAWSDGIYRENGRAHIEFTLTGPEENVHILFRPLPGSLLIFAKRLIIYKAR